MAEEKILECFAPGWNTGAQILEKAKAAEVADEWSACWKQIKSAIARGEVVVGSHPSEVAGYRLAGDAGQEDWLKTS